MPTNERPGWRLPLSAGALALVACGAIVSCVADAAFAALECLLLILLVSFVLIILAIRRSRAIPIVTAILLLWAASAALLFYNSRYPFAIREAIRWALWSKEYKQQVMQQPVPANGDIRHVVWDATGFAGIANNTACLVFDPDDSLSGGAGLPCNVWAIRRLERKWYAVVFYTDEDWYHCGGADAARQPGSLTVGTP